MHRSKQLSPLLVMLLVISITNSSAFGQCDPPFGRIRNSEGSTKIDVQLNFPITDDELKNRAAPERWLLIDVSTTTPERPLRIVSVNSDRSNLQQDIVHLTLFSNRLLELGHEYRLFAPFLTFSGCKPKAVSEAAFSVTEKRAVGTAVVAAPLARPETNYFKKSPSKGRADSNVYLSGQIEGANRGSPQFAADIKLESPFDTAGFFHELGPYFNFKASTASAADANSMSFGLKLRHAFPFKIRTVEGTTEIARDQPFLSGIVWEITPGFESDRQFDNINLVAGNKFVFVPRVIGNSNRIYFQPFIGFEAGRNLKSPVSAAAHRNIARGTIGGSLYLNLLPKADKALSLQIDYIRRFLLLREISFEEDKDKKLVALPVGRGPRDHLKLTLEYDFSDFMGTGLNYEYGRLPPNFELVDHKYGFGLIYKFKTKFKP
ncbi:MAG TPA: hypothetical protein VJU86_16975 [Pyrinomonadaceae bacterium]|nr:hypothetical protein [Pyrinomonadaceae bacterium]